MKFAELTFYGTGDECYELWSAGLHFYENLVYVENPNSVLRKRLLSWLKATAKLSREDYTDWIGDPDDPHADKVTVEVLV